MAEGKDTPTSEQEKQSDKRPPWWKRLWTRTGVGDKTLWDLLQLLIVPLALAVIGFWFTAQQDVRQQQIENQRAKAERKLAEQRAQDEALQAYLDQMSTLLLEKDLRTSEEDSEVRTLARARTLTVLGRLDPSRKSAVMEFLVEAELVQRVEGSEPIIRLAGTDLSAASLSDANLSGAVLFDADLSNADLGEVNLSNANLSGANLSGANLNNANLNEADLSRANLSNADLGGAKSRAANLSEANLSNADLNSTYLSEANLKEADLGDANLSAAYLREANLWDANLSNAFLGDAYLRNADLNNANLSNADLDGVDMIGANLTDASMRSTHLRNADLSDADLSNVYLHRADLSRANLSGANLSGADLSDANLKDASGITQEELEKQASTLEGATMPPSGQYASNKFKPAVTFEIGEDWNLVPPETPDRVMFLPGWHPSPLEGALVFTNPLSVFDPSNLSEPKELPEPENGKAWISWFQSHPNLDTSKPVPVSVGGASGMRIDVTVSTTPEKAPRDLCGPEPCVPLFTTDEFMNPAGTFAGYGGLKDRFVIVDVGGETVLIGVAAPADKFDEILPKAQEVLDSVEWKKENSGSS